MLETLFLKIKNFIKKVHLVSFVKDVIHLTFSESKYLRTSYEKSS